MPDEPLWQRRALAGNWWPPEAMVLAQAQAEVETARSVLEVLSAALPTSAFTDAVHAVDEMFDERMGLCDCYRIEFVDVEPAAQGSLW